MEPEARKTHRSRSMNFLQKCNEQQFNVKRILNWMFICKKKKDLDLALYKNELIWIIALSIKPANIKFLAQKEINFYVINQCHPKEFNF